MSSYIRFEMLLFFRCFETGIILLLFYRAVGVLCGILPRCRWMKNITDILYWLFAGCMIFSEIYRYNYGCLRVYMLSGDIVGAFFANSVLNRLLFLIKRCKISSYKYTKRCFWSFRRSRQLEKVKKEK